MVAASCLKVLSGPVSFSLLALLVGSPIVYSYLYYKKEMK